MLTRVPPARWKNHAMVAATAFTEQPENNKTWKKCEKTSLSPCHHDHHDGITRTGIKQQRNTFTTINQTYCFRILLVTMLVLQGPTSSVDCFFYCNSETHDAMVENDDDGDFLILWIFGLLRVARWSEVASQYPGGRTGTSNGTAVGPAAVFNFSGYGTVHCLRGKVPVQQKPCFLIATGAQHGSVIPGKPMLLPVATSNSACLYKIFGMRVGSRACC